MATASSWLFASQGRGKDMLLTTFAGIGNLRGICGNRSIFWPAGVASQILRQASLFGVPILYYLAGREGPVTTADLWAGFLRSAPVWVVVCGATLAMYLSLADSTAIVQLAMCTPVGLVAGSLVVWFSFPLRQTALRLVDIPRKIVSRLAANRR
jgi:hypothetical protein